MQWVNDFDDAVEQVLDLLRDSDGTAQGKTKAFFLRGWYGIGLGASAVLRTIAELLKSTASDASTRKHFGKIIHVDCSMWKSRRAMQRAITEELNLRHLMPTFDKQDEEDDFRGVHDSSRAEITSIGSVIHESLINERFLMVFHYGGDEDIDLAECGIPLFGSFGKGKLLWTDHGRFQLSESEQRLKSSSVDIRMYISPSDVRQQLRHVLHKEAVEVIGYTGMDGIDPAKVVDCFLYSLFLTEQVRGNSIHVDYGWATHACSYWICDGILQGDRAWEVGNALYRVIRQLGYSSDETEVLAPCLDRRIKPYEGWNSITSDKLGARTISTVPSNASSYFLTFERDGQLELRNDLFQLAASNLRVLKLCKCSFDFASPPFLRCQNLRFLWLDQCTNTGKEQGEGPCFPNLLVLDVRYTYYLLLPQMIELMTNLRELNTEGVSWRTISHACRKLQNLQKLRLIKSSEVITVDSCSSVDMVNLELLDLSGNTRMESLPAMSSARSLTMLVLDGCSSLEHVALEGAPLLEIFSFDGYGPTENWTHPIQLPEKEEPYIEVRKINVRKISLEGCARLRSIFLRTLPNLEELDLSGTAIKTLDLRAMDVPQLKMLFLLRCEQLCSLLWDGNNPTLEVLHVDTRGKGKTSGLLWKTERFADIETSITFTDGRFNWSAMRIVPQVNKVHIHVCSMLHSQVSITKSIEVIGPSQVGLVPTGPLLPYKDIGLAEDVACSALMWDCQQLQALDVHMEIGEGSHDLDSMHDNANFIQFLNSNVQSLHVHDCSSITAITPRVPLFWNYLEWCHVERCPKLHTLFTQMVSVEFYIFPALKIFSACDLLMAHCIWSKGIHSESFEKLQHIYLHNCPRLVFVLHISFTLPSLETLQIEYCSNLKHIFPLGDKHPNEIAAGVTFDKLKHIKLQHLHKLEQICEARLSAPLLKTISLRDCWGLRRLPTVARGGPKPVVDCEKDWWDKLEWDNHDPSLFETRHSAYYKKSIPRGSLLR